MPPKTLNQYNGMPQMGLAFAGWQALISIEKIVQTVGTGSNAGFVSEAGQLIVFKGTVQPLKANLIALKPEGQRSFEWLQIHCFSGALNLTPGDKIKYKNGLYKVMGQNDYSNNNYIEYQIIKDYE